MKKTKILLTTLVLGTTLLFTGCGGSSQAISSGLNQMSANQNRLTMARYAAMASTPTYNNNRYSTGYKNTNSYYTATPVRGTRNTYRLNSGGNRGQYHSIY